MPNEEVTDLLIAYGEGDADALGQLVPLLYDDLRRLAHYQLSKGRRGATLDTTALVHETYLKLVDQTKVDAANRAHFLAIAARAMRQVLVDYARAKYALKRGEGRRPVVLDKLQLGVREQVEFLLALDTALDRLRKANSRLAAVFECRYFGGMTDQETADSLGVARRTTQRDWMKSKAWRRTELERG
ncbi:MAG: ECF-type sigma factor, partial [Thermoanaerobaculia bacterium]|nr:ECF-type sigma factor [Thermoanaerobaculia bacterium]